MKNQYFGDINDYRKYGFLRTLTQVSGLRVGVCWLLTPDDGKGDGELRAYLKKPTKWRRYDPGLFDALSRLLNPGVTRSVLHAREWGLVPDAEYFEPMLPDQPAPRTKYFASAWEQLAGCPLLFVDPDNGIEVSGCPWGGRGSSRYVFWRELKTAFALGHSVLIYQHYPRVPHDRFLQFLADRISEELGCSRVIAFSTSHVAFFLAQQAAHCEALEGVAQAVATMWPGQVAPWPEAFLGAD